MSLLSFVLDPPEIKAAEARIFDEDEKINGKKYVECTTVCHPLNRHVIDLARTRFDDSDECNPVSERGLYGGGYVEYDTSGLPKNKPDGRATASYSQYLFRRLVASHAFKARSGCEVLVLTGITRLNGGHELDNRCYGCIAAGIPWLAPQIVSIDPPECPTLVDDEDEFHMEYTKGTLPELETLEQEFPFNQMWVRYHVPLMEKSADKPESRAEDGQVPHDDLDQSDNAGLHHHPVLPPTPPPADLPQRLLFDPFRAVYLLRLLLALPVLEKEYVRDKSFTDPLLAILDQVVTFSDVFMATTRSCAEIGEWVPWFRKWIMGYSCYALGEANPDGFVLEMTTTKTTIKGVPKPSEPTWPHSLAETIIAREWMMGVQYTAAAFRDAVLEAIAKADVVSSD